MWSSEWRMLVEVALIAVLIYVLLIVLLRITGKRTTSKMNNFDWIVTVAMGSMVSTVILVDDVSLLQGLVGISTLVVLQYVVAWSAVRSSWFERIVKASPALLYYGGEFHRDVMRRQRVTRAEVLSAVRQQGHTSLDDVVAVVLETNAELSILAGAGDDPVPTLDDVE